MSFVSCHPWKHIKKIQKNVSVVAIEHVLICQQIKTIRCMMSAKMKSQDPMPYVLLHKVQFSKAIFQIEILTIHGK